MTPEMIHAFQRNREAHSHREGRHLQDRQAPHPGSVTPHHRFPGEGNRVPVRSFRVRPTEALYAIALNSCNDFLGLILLSSGSVDRATVYPRELVSFLLFETNATALLIAHNHPGGREEASPQDIALTRHLMEVMKPLEVRLLDHLIYSAGRPGEKPRWTSLRAKGLM